MASKEFSELNGKQPNLTSANAPPIPTDCWTNSREEIHAWLNEESPSLAELYKGAVFLAFEGSISGRIKFISHAVREIRNRLHGKATSYLNYSDEIRDLVELWRSHSLPLNRIFPNTEVTAEDTLPTTTPDLLMPRPLFLKIQKLLQKHLEVSYTNQEKARRFFEAYLPPEARSDILIPLANHWWKVTEWFMARAHDSGAVDADCNEQEFQSQFEQFESFLSTLARSFYSTIDELDKILEDTNS